MKKITKILLCICISISLIVPVNAGQLASQYNTSPYVDMGKSTFTENEKVLTSFENYNNLDSLGRCGVAFANICKEIMPTKERESIGMIKPSGWQTPQSKYDFIDGKFLYNRCHLIAYELAGENANEKNLVTGTRYMNIDGMLPFENKVANHVKSTNHHVLYRTTPVFEGNNLLCDGVQIEAYCVEENGGSIDFNVFCYNVQSGVVIDYATGKDCTNTIANVKEDEVIIVNATNTYVLNKKSKKIHIPTCSGVKSVSEKIKFFLTRTLQHCKDKVIQFVGIVKQAHNKII